MVTGASLTYIGGTGHRPLPVATERGYRAAHKPWCTSCKRTDPLNDDGLCQRCVKANETRARLAARRAEREAAAAEAAQEAPAAISGEESSPAPEEPEPAPSPAAPAAKSTARKAETARGTRPAKPAHARRRSRPRARKRKRTAPKPRGPRPDKIHLPSPDVEDAYTAGATIRELADQHGVSAPTIARHLDDHGVARRKQKVDYSRELIEAVRTRYVDLGMTQAQVAADLDLTTKIVQTAMTRGDITARESAVERSRRGIGSVHKFTPEQRRDMVEAYRSGQSAPAVAAAYGCSAPTVYTILRDAGVEHRHHRRSAPGHDGAANLRRRIEALGATSHDIKTWALEQGLADHIATGTPAQALVDAWAAAHPTTEEVA